MVNAEKSEDLFKKKAVKSTIRTFFLKLINLSVKYNFKLVAKK